MSRITSLAITIGVIICFTAISGNSVEGPVEKSDKWAILIGVNKYDDSSIATLKYSVADVTAVYHVLVDPKRGGFDKSRVYLLTDDTPTKPVKDNIFRVLKFLENASDPDDTVLIYFSGHGFEEKGTNYLLPKDAKLPDLSRTAVDFEELERMIVKAKIKRQIMILDACHSGFREDRLGSGIMTEEFAKGIFSRSEGKAILSSSNIDESSYEFPHVGHGAFTYYLLEALNGHADLNRDQLITLSEAALHVRQKVSQWALENRKKQTPMFYADGLTDIVLAKKPH